MFAGNVFGKLVEYIAKVRRGQAGKYALVG
jgi:hypothetical protein